ncbi:cytosolic endo-beta-N-acetylglucosaminidase [Chelonus insularis]|uniref:cytosolic endo-beta-N-acetylglucosaminidase n=1 Tax=Chelonus insularis TaxID=460826 RepID=UPI00158E076A|nr:cytosolic endo-beta-N-acetylglucosaminidase [Chelonus insularis]
MANSIDTYHRTAKPFATLDALYDGLKNLEPWLDIVKLRECTDYVYDGKEICDLKGVTGRLTKLNRDKKPKTIICHDMKGGYLEDRFLYGSLAHDSYLFYHWSIVDIFIYFSHYLVTIPPYGWINAAHNHGVKVLGTVITERTDGEIIWEHILSSIEETKKFADALVMLAKYYKFEGWLLNIENEIQKDHIQQLLYFVQYLTVEMHSNIEGSEVIWYDSVTIDGKLKWQNQLNEHNKDFFENCDGIFLNYNWTDAGLATSRAMADLNNRVQDIYVGLDVWGRGCPGGGGFNSIEALKNIREHDLSVAIFAPGWTHENFNAKDFMLIENIFWAQLTPYLYVHVPIYENVSFSSSFCIGSGEKFYYHGECDKYAAQPFYNLSWQQPQMSVPSIHLKFTSVRCLKKKNEVNEVSEEKKEKFIPECIYETALQVITVRGHEIRVEKKLQSELKNNIYCSKRCPYNGGKSVKITTSDSQVYYRLFLVHLEFNSDVQIYVIHRSSEDLDTNEATEQTANHPTLILLSNQSFQFMEPYETFEINAKWKKSYYRTINRTINEIGVRFSKTGTYYLGKINIQPLPAIHS